MSHSLIPSTEYELVTITVAVPRGPWESCDVLNEMLRPPAIYGEIGDYTLHGMRHTEYKTTSSEAEEGELFSEAPIPR